ncbi:hypothetical protein B0G80_0966 [Paraburkholderia sp. BL6669N2]|uniref:hypothetical protein n=1 Tax=unclassified Paraburkholderia TaxID=2615204 RepID=UPI000E38788E|nr:MULTISPECIES: hypothetical protein [unclassified Paraburkholderia]REE19214.1 hypothetical protein B0G71_2291 [Paraburkholderia sp. BL27I4N3]REG58316.1 hypothetical protein B0G80_0966 [Paraburkholderia sp. BL6669N2]
MTIKKIGILLAACIFLGIYRIGVAAERTVFFNGTKIHYDNEAAYLQPRCALFLRHQPADLKSRYAMVSNDVCRKYQATQDENYSFPGAQGEAPVKTPKRDFVTLDEIPLWKGKPPVRAKFNISFAVDDPDPDINPSYLPYIRKNKISDYLLIDEENYETSLATGKRTGYRFYRFEDMCFLATEKKPRSFKFETACVHAGNPNYAFPKAVDTISHPWINIMERNTIDLDERMPNAVEIDGSSPVKPLIYSDFPIDNSGRVTQGRAMCMADCAPGMLFRVLHKHQSIWGASGKPPATVR